MKSELEAIELHDALLESVKINCSERKVTLELHFYRNLEDRVRTPLSLDFLEVPSVSSMTDLLRMRANAFAGNVSHWLPSEGPGTSYIYLTDGCIAITAKSISIGILEGGTDG